MDLSTCTKGPEHIHQVLRPLKQVKEFRAYLAAQREQGDFQSLPSREFFDLVYNRKYTAAPSSTDGDDDDEGDIDHAWGLFQRIVVHCGGQPAMGGQLSQDIHSLEQVLNMWQADQPQSIRSMSRTYHALIVPIAQEWISEIHRVRARQAVRIKYRGSEGAGVGEIEQEGQINHWEIREVEDALLLFSRELGILSIVETKLEEVLGDRETRMQRDAADYIQRIAQDAPVRSLLRELPAAAPPARTWECNLTMLIRSFLSPLTGIGPSIASVAHSPARSALNVVQNALMTRFKEPSPDRIMLLKLMQDIVNSSEMLPAEWEVPYGRIGKETSRKPVEGGEAMVYFHSCETLDRRVVAVRCPTGRPLSDDLGIKEWDIKRRYRRAIVVYAHLHHPHLLPFEGYTVSKKTASLFHSIIMKAMETTLREYCFSAADDRQRMFIQIASALDYLHGHDIAHGDIHWKNVLVDHEGNMYLADFGFSRLVQNENSTTTSAYVAAMPQFSAPEAVLAPHVRPRPEGDLFGCGIVFLSIAITAPGASPKKKEAQLTEYAGKLKTKLLSPNSTSNVEEARPRPKMPGWESQGEKLWCLLNQMTEGEPTKRPVIGPLGLRSRALASANEGNETKATTRPKTVVQSLMEIFPEGHPYVEAGERSDQSRLWEEARTSSG